MTNNYELLLEASDICRRLKLRGNEAILYSTYYVLSSGTRFEDWNIYHFSRLKHICDFRRAKTGLIKKGLLFDQDGVVCLFDRRGAAFDVPKAK